MSPCNLIQGSMFKKHKKQQILTYEKLEMFFSWTMALTTPKSDNINMPHTVVVIYLRLLYKAVVHWRVETGLTRRNNGLLRVGVNVDTEQFLTLLFDFAFEKSLHGIFCGHVQWKLPFTVHCPDLSIVLYQVPVNPKNKVSTQWHWKLTKYSNNLLPDITVIASSNFLYNVYI